MLHYRIGFIVYNIFKNVIMEYSNVHKLRYGIRQNERKMSNSAKGETEENTFVAQHKDWYFQVRLYNGCFAGRHNRKEADVIEHSPHVHNRPGYVSLDQVFFLTILPPPWSQLMMYSRSRSSINKSEEVVLQPAAVGGMTAMFCVSPGICILPGTLSLQQDQ